MVGAARSGRRRRPAVVIFPLTAAGLFLLVTLVPALLVGLVRLWRGRPQRRYWSALLWAHLLLAPVHLFVTFPAALGWFGSRGLGTRGDERAWAGPRIAADGTWQLQTRATLRAEDGADRARTADDPRVAVLRVAGDGVALRVFRVAPLPAGSPPRAAVVLVHGLFRSAMEIEAPAAMFRELGCEVWLVEQRNHGGSGRAPATYGLCESRDVLAVVRHLRAEPGRGNTPLFLFGVSLGSVAVALALPELGSVAGVVLDAPVGDLLATAHHMLGLQRAGDRRRRFALHEPWRSLVLASVQLWSGFELASVRPDLALTGLSADLPVLLIAGGEDDKVDPARVRALYDSLPMPRGVKELWIAPGAGHGDVWTREPDRYRARLQAFLHQALAAG